MSGELLAMVERSNTIKQDGVIRFNGLTYRLVTSPDTGRVWLDRNLGAIQACTSSANSACYGNLYQWGRDDDGHESRTSSTDGTRLAGISTVSTNYITGNNDWTTVSSGASALRIAAWANGGSNDICPAGFSVPTETELAADTTGASITNSASAFSSFLKLPVSGIRFADASINREGSTGYLWARSNGNGSHLRYKSGNASINGAYRAHGIGVRCIKG
ncbi:hypothetical protein BHECKSOX_1876 [Bathymodiolus heckerae thiotrophic gill symbiont]|uniref:FISUMP domain-containing protein n=1 Tax=Bathymodiolus heckerae thiotrophic gill symbiont TaxID=1052212 RepID=UPI0010B99CB3|nr:FISUMP domain-containing protein [Bathymodiolus heckerae thiotrophic gill symbiont]CAC9583410.1 hypothetical protein [uncultured Gammaproteobacteria bacterium]SHN91535.1 hypothetical protein BHECKSOX_1876 [Bathymodiolus heckerae thiotrophic gill symbiont]